MKPEKKIHKSTDYPETVSATPGKDKDFSGQVTEVNIPTGRCRGAQVQSKSVAAEKAHEMIKPTRCADADHCDCCNS